MGPAKGLASSVQGPGNAQEAALAEAARGGETPSTRSPTQKAGRLAAHNLNTFGFPDPS